MALVAADRRADVEDDRFAAQRRPQRRDRRPLDRRHRMQAELRHRHQRAGVAGRNHAVGGAGLHRLDRLPHRRDPPSGAQGLARLVGHLDRDAGMKQARSGGEGRIGGEHRPDRRLVAVQTGTACPAGARARSRRRAGRRKGRCRLPLRQALCECRSPFPRPMAPEAPWLGRRAGAGATIAPSTRKATPRRAKARRGLAGTSPPRVSFRRFRRLNGSCGISPASSRRGPRGPQKAMRRPPDSRGDSNETSGLRG